MSNNHGQPLPVHAAYQHSKGENLLADVAPIKAGELPTAVGQFPLTPPDILGPYFLPNSPKRTDLLADETGPVITLTGIVQDKKGFPLPNCKLDFWMANTKGVYSGFADQGTEGADYCRGHTFTDDEGNFQVRFRKPGHYKISDTEERTAHVHLQYKPTNGPVQTTQLYFADDLGNATDPWEQKNDPLLCMEKVSDTELRYTVTAKTYH